MAILRLLLIRTFAESDGKTPARKRSRHCFKAGLITALAAYPQAVLQQSFQMAADQAPPNLDGSL
jgi:hypothetical protein